MFPRGGADDLSNQLELSIQCTNLKNKDTLSKSDPMCVLRMKEGSAASFVEIGRTERIENNLNPVFTKTFRLTYYFERKQDLQFEMYDCDSSSQNVTHHDKLGHIEVSVAEVVQGRLQRGRMLLDSGNKTAKIHVTARQSVDCRESYRMQFVGRGLDNKDFFSKSDPYLVFHKQVNGNFVAIGKTEVVNNNLNPVWNPITINCATFNDKNDQLPLKIECFDFDDDGKHDFIGHFFTTGSELFQSLQKPFPLINEKKKEKKKKYDNSGTIILQQFTVEEECEFLFYIQAGLQLSFMVAIDFTASNGNPADPNSLHYFNPNFTSNQYTSAIQAVGQVIQEYDTDKLFPVFGFGGRFFGNHQVLHTCPLNGNPQNPNVCGVQGILDAYRYALSHSQLAGPTNFEPTIRSALETASRYQSGLHYFVLLIITDGAITDLYRTIDAIVEASYYPLSIIIVGVGGADFDSMEELDSDKKMLKSSYGKVAQRDIVQFVALRDIFGHHFDPNHLHQYQDQLARQVLAEVPRQVKDHLKPKGVYPSIVNKLFQQAFPPSAEQQATRTNEGVPAL